MVARDDRLSSAQKAAILDPENSLLVSAATAYEYAHLLKDGRLPIVETFAALQRDIGFELLDLPAKIWETIDTLPIIHRDPIDRMLVAHGIVAGLTVVTADRNIKLYPVKTI